MGAVYRARDPELGRGVALKIVRARGAARADAQALSMDREAQAMTKLTQINAWYAEQFATLIAGLQSYPEGEGTLFVNSLLLWSNELGKGNSHSRMRAPYVLAGSAGGALETGRYLRYDGDPPHNELLVSVLNVLGVPYQSFGLADWCKGPLSGIV